jgi:UDP-N-acetylmuramyl pentapeptide phosphotransferase/UDP-N-acetylglucosamine-1-phosphate transferase
MHRIIAADFPVWLSMGAFGASLALSHGLIRLLWPVLKRYALARPNARSSHRTPTPQGGGIAVIGAILIVVSAAYVLGGAWPAGEPIIWGAVAVATLGLAAVGAVDDLREVSPLPRLILHFATVALVIFSMPAEFRIVPWVPWGLERVALLLAGVWFVNLVNFMDGIDWITVAEVVPITGGLVLLGALGALPPSGTVAASALAGAMIGFAPFNRPVARLFLGDVGSVPVGLLLAWLLFLLASGGHLAAALLLPLYYLADTAITLLIRLWAGHKVWQAHRCHFYQRATARGVATLSIVRQVLMVNLLLVALAAATVIYPSIVVESVALAVGCVLIAALLLHFSRASS